MAQFNSANGAYQQQAKTLFETTMLASTDGVPISNTNPLPVSLGGANVNIIGDVTIPASVEISNDVGNPVPVSGTVSVSGITGNVTLSNTSTISVIGTETNPWGKLVLTIDDNTVQHTSRNRRKVSTQETFYFNSFQNGDEPEVWDESVANGANSEFDQYEGGVNLRVSNTAGSEIIRQTRSVVRYIPGRQNELIGSLRLNTPQAGIRRRVGLFDANNGIYFEDDGGTYSCVVRRGTATGNEEIRVTRDNWNVDKLDGTGPSGYTANAEAMQMFTFDYEWFGAGQVEWNWIIENNKIPIHRHDTGNIRAHSWSNTPSLPYRLEMTNTTGATGTHEFLQGGFCIMAEGTVGPIGRRRNASSPITGRTMSLANTFYPILSLRLDPTQLTAVIQILEFQCATLDNTNVFYKIVRDSTLTGASWQSLDRSSAQYDISATANTTAGTTVTEGFINGTNQGQQNKLADQGLSYTQIARNDIGTTSQVYTFYVAATNANKKAFVSIDWIELR